MTTLKTTVHNRRIDVPAPSDIPDGAEVTLTIAEVDGNALLPPVEIARVLTGMQMLQPWIIPDDVAVELDAWERQINKHGIEHLDTSAENVFP